MNEGGRRFEKDPAQIQFNVLPAEELDRIKGDLFEGGGIEITEAGPHGIDFPVETFLDYGELLSRKVRPAAKQRRGLRLTEEAREAGTVVFRDEEINGERMQVARLKPGHTYLAMLAPALKVSEKELRGLDLDIKTYPRSTLLRVGIEAVEESWNPHIEFRLLLPEFFPGYSDKRGIVYLRVLNPNGVMAEKGASLFQVAVRKGLRSLAKKPLSETLPQDLTREPSGILTLGSVRAFGQETPFITSKEHERLERVDVTEPLPDEGGTFHLSPGVYLLESQEQVKLDINERGRLGEFVSIPEAATGTGDALVDAGFQGPLHFLIKINRPVDLRHGQRLTSFFIDKVPPTTKPYRGKWRKND